MLHSAFIVKHYTNIFNGSTHIECLLNKSDNIYTVYYKIRNSRYSFFFGKKYLEKIGLKLEGFTVWFIFLIAFSDKLMGNAQLLMLCKRFLNISLTHSNLQLKDILMQNKSNCAYPLTFSIAKNSAFYKDRSAFCE